MGRIIKKVKIRGLTNKILEVDALFDTGSDYCGVTNKLADKLGIHSTKWGKGTVVLGDGREIEKEIYAIGIQVDECYGFTDTHIYDKLPTEDINIDIIIGNKAMQTLGDFDMDFDQETISCKMKKAGWFSFFTKIKEDE